MEKIYDKLVRDRIPQICLEHGETPVTRILDDGEYWEYLLRKDAEELEEVRGAENLEERKKELADKLELIRAMAKYSGFTLDEIIKCADEKAEKRGAFDDRILLIKVTK